MLFVDEVHRFNKAQQDAFLPHIERGTILFVGATTENPSFELNSALLSRCRVHVLEAVSAPDIARALRQALDDEARGLGGRGLRIDDAALGEIAAAADGDVRRALTLLEIAADIAEGEGGAITEATLHQVLADRTRRFDKGGEQFYDQISALHKSVRSSNPDGAMYWLARMLDGGCDPSYLLRRLTIMAVEDIGLADPRALEMALERVERLRPPRSARGRHRAVQPGHLPRQHRQVQCRYMALKAARADIAAHGTQPVPMHLRNAPTRLMKALGYGTGYQYDHDVEGGIALDQTAFPEAMGERVYYQPVGARAGNQAQGEARRLARGARPRSRRARPLDLAQWRRSGGSSWSW